jgi:phosphatidylglycerol---prolipoprotein diacylglyceryl transferase
MYPHLISVGPLHIYTYGFMMALSFAAGLAHWIWLGRARGYSKPFCTDLMVWVMVSGIVGARMAFVLENLSSFLASPAEIIRIDQGGLIFHGGLAGAALAVLVFSRRHKIPLVGLIDFTLTAVPLSHALGRIGCFMNSCCFGVLHQSGCCGVTFPKYSGPWYHHVQSGLIDGHASRSLAVHPVQLYEAGFNLVVYGILLLVYRRQKRPGFVAAVYLIVYALGRFMLEYFRGDHFDRVTMAGLSSGQIVSATLFLAGLGLLSSLLYLARRCPREAG